MVIECPPCQWPNTLEERGPSEDPSILLTGTARIGKVEVQIIATRVQDTQCWTPDFKRKIAEEIYRVDGLAQFLEATLEDLESMTLDLVDLLGGKGASVVQLPTGLYRIWVMPVSPEA